MATRRTSTSGTLTTLPTGEIGVLEQAKVSVIDPSTCFIMMSHDGNYHIGRLFVDIGTLDIPYTP